VANNGVKIVGIDIELILGEFNISVFLPLTGPYLRKRPYTVGVFVFVYYLGLGPFDSRQLVLWMSSHY